jgi:long-chain acyl-CoA synthetase
LPPPTDEIPRRDNADHLKGYEENRKLEANAEARRLMEADIRQLINHERGFKSFERISDFRFVPKPFEVGEEMTNTFKLKRHVITEKYRPLIESMYS